MLHRELVQLFLTLSCGNTAALVHIRLGSGRSLIGCSAGHSSTMSSSRPGERCYSQVCHPSHLLASPIMSTSSFNDNEDEDKEEDDDDTGGRLIFFVASRVLPVILFRKAINLSVTRRAALLLAFRNGLNWVAEAVNINLGYRNLNNIIIEQRQVFFMAIVVRLIIVLSSNPLLNSLRPLRPAEACSELNFTRAAVPFALDATRQARSIVAFERSRFESSMVSKSKLHGTPILDPAMSDAVWHTALARALCSEARQSKPRQSKLRQVWDVGIIFIFLGLQDRLCTLVALGIVFTKLAAADGGSSCRQQLKDVVTR